MKNHIEVRNPASGVYFSSCHADRPPLDFVRTRREVSVFGGNKRDSCCWAVDCCCRVLVYHSSFPWYKPRDAFYDRRVSDLVRVCAIRHQRYHIVIESLLLYTLLYVTCLLEDLTVKIFQTYLVVYTARRCIFDPRLRCWSRSQDFSFVCCRYLKKKKIRINALRFNFNGRSVTEYCFR